MRKFDWERDEPVTGWDEQLILLSDEPLYVDSDNNVWNKDGSEWYGRVRAVSERRKL